MTWELFYLICFGVGLVMTVVSFAGGGVHHSLHFGHWHFGLHHAHHGHAGSHGVSFLNGFTVTAFLCWFGGAGYLLERYGRLVAPVILGLALLTGLAGASLIFLFLARVLAPHDRALTPEDTEMTGVIARVSGTIRQGGTGEILFSQNGARRSSPARSDTGDTVARDTEVVVMRYERGIAYVRRWDELSDGEVQT
jgi:hypothetical protein